jgi:hypothetical protein
MSHFLDPSDAQRVAYINTARRIVCRLPVHEAWLIIVMNAT